MIETKHCERCGEDKPVTEEHWNLRATKTMGLRPYMKVCRACHSALSTARSKKRAEADPEGFKERHAATERARKKRRLEDDPEGFRAARAADQAALRERRGDEWRAKQAEYARRSRERKKAAQEGQPPR